MFDSVQIQTRKRVCLSHTRAHAALTLHRLQHHGPLSNQLRLTGKHRATNISLYVEIIEKYDSFDTNTTYPLHKFQQSQSRATTSSICNIRSGFFQVPSHTPTTDCYWHTRSRHQVRDGSMMAADNLGSSYIFSVTTHPFNIFNSSLLQFSRTFRGRAASTSCWRLYSHRFEWRYVQLSKPWGYLSRINHELMMNDKDS